MVAGRCEVLQDLSNHLLLQVCIAANAQAVRQRQHKALLHLHGSPYVRRDAPDLRIFLAYRPCACYSCSSAGTSLKPHICIRRLCLDSLHQAKDDILGDVHRGSDSALAGMLYAGRRQPRQLWLLGAPRSQVQG